MENQNKKCSSNKHSSIDAISYCPECKKFLCNKCQNFHSELFYNHILSSLDKELNDTFIDICSKENHHIKLEFFCKNHNELCCSSCICKIKNELYGQHRDCDVCLIKEIVDEKKKKLKENINILEDLSKNFEKSIQELKNLFDKINESKEQLKLKIQKIFTKIRNSLNDKEDKIMLEIDEKFNDIFIKENIIKASEKMPNKIKTSLEKGKILEKDWKDSNNKLFINYCINIENNIKEIYQINDDIKKCNSNQKTKIELNIEENKINNFIENIEALGKLIIKKEYDFDIQLKKPIHELNFHTGNVLCLTLLNDGRLVSCARDESIIIYNEKTYQPDLIIKEHTSGVLCICKLSSGILASCSNDKTIKLFKIKGKKYKILQTLTNHSDTIYKIIELKNKTLISCSSDSSIIFYYEDKLQYKQNYKIHTDGSCSSVIQTKENEICSSERNNNKICFYSIENKKCKASITNINKRNFTDEWLILISENLLAIPGENIISIVNLNKYILVRTINTDSSWILGSCMLNENVLITGDRNYMIKQWEIEDDNLILISQKENAHKGDINTLLNLGNGHIASGSDGGAVKIW